MKTFTNKGCKIAWQRKVCFWVNFALLRRIFWYQCFSLCLTVFLLPFPEVQYPNFLDFRNYWEKVIERSGLRFKIKLLLIKGVKSPRQKKLLTDIFCHLFIPFKRHTEVSFQLAKYFFLLPFLKLMVQDKWQSREQKYILDNMLRLDFLSEKN